MQSKLVGVLQNGLLTASEVSLSVMIVKLF